MKNFTLDIDADGIALITFDSPGRSMNVLSLEAISEVGEWTARLRDDPAIKGAVLTSGKDTGFCAGADLDELGSVYAQAETLSDEDSAKLFYDTFFTLNQTFRAIETCGKPVAAAINGIALGGGLEITLACHYRIAASDNPRLKLGLPEALVGVLPGGGGTQRMPRLLGALNALDLMLQGKQVDANHAATIGLVNATAPTSELVAKAKEWVKANSAAQQPWDKEDFRIPGGGPYHPKGIQVFGAAGSMLRRNTYGNYPAQRFILSAVYEGLQVDIDTGLRIETRYFARLLRMPESRNMIRSIFISKQALEKGARRPEGQEKGKIQKLGVVGAGFMGAGVASVAAQAGIDVILIDRDQESAQRGRDGIDTSLADRVAKGRMDAAKKDQTLARITATADYALLKGADIVIEAVFESRDVKQPVIANIYEAVGPETIVASNTSTLPITSLAEYGADPERFCGIHFFSPVEKMQLVEVIKGEKTGARAISRAIDLAAALKKTPIVVEDSRGFFANRCVFRFLQQGVHMLEEGVLPALIENASRMAGMPVGPLALYDEIALDLGWKVVQAEKEDLGPDAADKPTERILGAMMQAERFGRKNGKGFYAYPAGAPKHLREELGQFAKRGLLPEGRQPTPEEIRDRVLYAQALEAARCFEEGVVTDPREADVGSILGWGFAPFTGGVLSFIDTIGAKAFVRRARELQSLYGEPFAVPTLLKSMAKTGGAFYGQPGAGKGGGKRRAA